MSRALVILAVVMVAAYCVADSPESSQTASRAPASPPPPPPKGLLAVDRVWSEFDIGNALVSYHNNTDRTFAAVVEVQCNAVDATGRKLGTNTRSFFARERGAIAPGFRGTVKIPIDLHGAVLSRMDCSVISAR